MDGFSVLRCLPVARTDRPSESTGAVMRPDTFRRYVVDAGFRDVSLLPIDNDFYAFYRLLS